MNNLLLISVFFGLYSLVSCSDHETEKTNDKTEEEISNSGPVPGVPFFEFTAVYHYSIEISEDAIWSLRGTDSSGENHLLYELLRTNYPEDISDTSFIAELEPLGFTKNKLDASLHESVRDLFSEKDHTKLIENMSVPEFRDIFIFRDSATVSGIAKVNFGDKQSHILGAKVNPKWFGMSGDYDRLWTLLNDE